MSKEELKRYTVELSEQDIVVVLEMLNFMGHDRKSKQASIVEKKLYKALGV